MLSARGTKTTRLQRRKSGLGFSIKGGREHGIGVVVSWIEEEGPAAKSLNLGDEILAVNGEPLYGLSHGQVVEKLRQAGPSVVLLVHPNQTLQDIFSSSNSTHFESALSPAIPLLSARDDGVAVTTSTLPHGWGQKVDQKTGRVYFENHYTNTTTWSDPRTWEPVPVERFQWESLPPGWERCMDTQGDCYYVNHHTQTTHWDPPRGIRELQLLQQLRDFLAAQKEKLKSEEEDLAGKRRVLLAKNAELDLQQAASDGPASDGPAPRHPVPASPHDPASLSHDPASHDSEGEELRVDSKGDLLDDIMLLNEEVDTLDEHLSIVRRHLHSLAAILQSARAEEVGEKDPYQAGAELALGLSSELGGLHVTVQRVLELVESVSKQRRGEAPLTSSIHHMLQLPTLVGKESVQERQRWIHMLPDRLTAKTNCEMRVELVLTREAVLYGQSLQEKLGLLSTQSLSHQGWEQLLEQLATLDFQLLQELYTEAGYSGFREKLEKLMTL